MKLQLPMQNISPPVLYYHSVAPKPAENWLLNFLTLPLADFEEQLSYLRDKQFRAVFFDEWLAYRKGEKTVSSREVCLAFDDGLLDNWVYAYPIAKKYGMRFTLFVCPECVDPRDIVRPTLEDVWSGRCEASELDDRGFISWKELELLQASGVVDVQSHTMSHDKFYSSTALRGFYYGGFEGFYPAINTRPEKKPFYRSDPDFQQWLPLGTPLFEEKSAAIALRYTINSEFFEEAKALAKKYALDQAEQRPAYENAVRQLHRSYHEKGRLVAGLETEAEYLQRLEYEIIESKKLIEEKLNKPVRFLCWPHGDNSHQAHALAISSGYLATTAGKMVEESNEEDRIPRIGTSWNHGSWLNRQKLHYKIASHYHQQPYYSLWLANEFKNKILQRS